MLRDLHCSQLSLPGIMVDDLRKFEANWQAKEEDVQVNKG
jgi:hypothetical protein